MAESSGTRTLSYPALDAVDWFTVFVNYSQALTNYMDGLAATVTDTSGNELLVFSAVANARNHVQISAAATGASPAIDAVGSDTNPGLALTPKGSGALNLDGLAWPTADGSANQLLQTDGAGTLSWGTALTAGSTSLSGMGDVTLTSLGDNELLQYDTGTASWINQTVGEIGLQTQDATLDDIASLTLNKGDLLTTTGTNIVDLAVGTSGQRLTVVSSATNGIAWAAAAGGAGSTGAMVFIETVSGSNVTSLESAGWDTSTYSSFWVLIEDLRPATDAVECQLRFTTNSGTSFASGASDYEWRTPLGSPATSQADTHMTIVGPDEWGNGALEGIYGYLQIVDAAASNRHTMATSHVVFRENDSSATILEDMGGRYNQSGTVNGIQFSASSGNIYGRLHVYGLKDS